MPVAIRHAELRDAPSLRKLLLHLGIDDEEFSIRWRLDRIIRMSDHAVIVAEEPPHGLIGIVHASISPTLLARPICEVSILLVASDHRNSGVGLRLLEQVQDWSMRRGIEDVRVLVKHSQYASHSFFEHIGFVELELQHIYVSKINCPLLPPDEEEDDMRTPPD